MDPTDSGAPFPTLETPRLRLREIVATDAPALLALHTHAEHMRWFGADRLSTLDHAALLVEMFAAWRRAPSHGTRWALERKEAPGLIGTCGVFSWHRAWRKCVTGYEIAPAHAGQGLMREALGAMFDWSFSQLGLNRIEAQIHPDNAASRRLVERLGFRQEGLQREVGYWAGAHHDLTLYALLRRDWTVQREQRVAA